MTNQAPESTQGNPGDAYACLECSGTLGPTMTCVACGMIHVIPQPGPQTQFVYSRSYMTLAGGARGGGKTYGLLMRPIFMPRMDGTYSGPLGALDDPDFSGVIFRRERERLRGPGRLWEIAKKFYEQLGGVKNENMLSITFPSGATIRFMGLRMEADVEKHRGAAYTWIGFEEGTEFTFGQILGLMRCNRNSGDCQIRPWMDLTCNPSRESWLLDFVEPYIWAEGSPGEGTPMPDMAAARRHFYIEEDELHWVEDDFPKMDPTAWRDGEGNGPSTFAFIPSTVEDNPALIHVSPDYVTRLMTQKRVARMRDRQGNWYASDVGGFFADAEIIWLNKLPPIELKSLWYWDLAATQRDEKTNINASAGVQACEFLCPVCEGWRFLDEKTHCPGCNLDSLGLPFVELELAPGEPEHIFWTIRTETAELGPKELRGFIRKCSLSTGIDVPVYIEQESASAGLITIDAFTNLVLPEFEVIGDPPKGTKMVRANDLAEVGERGLWWVTEGPGQRMVLNRGVRDFPALYGRDIIDASSGALRALRTHDWKLDPFFI